MPINRKLCYPALLLLTSLLIPDLDLQARGRRGYSRGSTSRYSGSAGGSRSSGSYNRGSMSSYNRGSSSSNYNRGSSSSSYGNVQSRSGSSSRSTAGAERSSSVSSQDLQNRSGTASSSRSTREGQRSSSASSQDLQNRSGTTGEGRSGGDTPTRQERDLTQPPADGTNTYETRRGGTVTSSTNTSGDTTTRNTTLETAGGESASGSRTTERSGDTIKSESDIRTSAGGSAETKTELKYDNGQIDKVKRETKTEDRYGFETERKGEAERKDGYVEYEREYSDSAGRDAKVEGEAWRGPDGQINKVGELDTKYWGDYDFATTRGRHGQAAAVYGPYGGYMYTGRPTGGTRVTVYGRSYYHSGYYYYNPYYWAGGWFYYPCYPPYGAYYWGVPTGAVVINISTSTYYQSESVYYKETVKEGKVAYEVVPAPSGATVTELPTGYATITVGEQKYYYYHNTFYRRVQQNNQWVFVVIEQPAGITTIEKLPADFEPAPVAEVTYFKADDKYYLPYLNKEQEIYLLVGEPTAPKVEAGGAQRPATTSSAPLQATLTVPEGTHIVVRTAGDLDSGSNSTGDHYTAYLESDLKVGESLVASRGSRVYGRLVEVEKAGSMSGKALLKLELTDILINDEIVSISTAAYEVDGKSAGTLKQIGGAAGIGALIGAVADDGEGALIGAAIGAGVGTAVAAATPGEQVKIPAQTLLDFTLDRPVTVNTTGGAAAD